MENCGHALRLCTEDACPVQHAGTQSNLGAAYAALPGATPEERAENLKRAVACCKAALEVYRKDAYPQYFCQTAANLGRALAELEDPAACSWLKEAHSLRQFLPEQGERIRELMREVCKEE